MANDAESSLLLAKYASKHVVSPSALAHSSLFPNCRSLESSAVSPWSIEEGCWRSSEEGVILPEFASISRLSIFGGVVLGLSVPRERQSMEARWGVAQSPQTSTRGLLSPCLNMLSFVEPKVEGAAPLLRLVRRKKEHGRKEEDAGYWFARLLGEASVTVTLIQRAACMLAL